MAHVCATCADDLVLHETKCPKKYVREASAVVINAAVKIPGIQPHAGGVRRKIAPRLVHADGRSELPRQARERVALAVGKNTPDIRGLNRVVRGCATVWYR